MLNKFLLYIKKYGLFILIVAICFIAIICAIFSFFHKRAISKVEEKTEQIIDKVFSQVTSASIGIKEIDATKNIKLEQSEAKRGELEAQLNSISKIEDRDERLQALIKFNKSIKVKL